MCALYVIPWICCKGHIFSQCVSAIELNAWDDEMTCCHRSFMKRKKERKKINKKRARWKRSDLMGNTPMFGNWVQIEMGKTF